MMDVLTKSGGVWCTFRTDISSFVPKFKMVNLALRFWFVSLFSALFKHNLLYNHDNKVVLNLSCNFDEDCSSFHEDEIHSGHCLHFSKWPPFFRVKSSSCTHFWLYLAHSFSIITLTMSF